ANLLSLSSLASDLTITYAKAEKFLLALEHTFVVKTLKPFYRNLTTEIKKAPKLYFLDLGLRNAVLDNFMQFDKRSDASLLIENHVFLELLKNFDGKINFWRTTGKAEVDFVLSKEGRIMPVEVKLSGKPGKSFHSFLKAYKPERGLIVTLDKFERFKIRDTLVYKVPVFYL
ncbi:MAG: DUF4143 domain-containing protein, partial [Candidatus Aenigmarchaeota archaeon]|nr:DUF4143 domain-containing protein [Candidatus Aenigmarchaeota archaeon]